MAGLWSDPICSNCQTSFNSIFSQSPSIEENLLFATNLEPEQLQGHAFAPTPSGIPQYVETLYAPPVSVVDTALEDQLWSDITERDGRSSQSLHTNEHRKAGNPSVLPQVVHAAQDFTATSFVTLRPAASSSPSKPTCPYCNKNFTRISDLNRHYYQIHQRLRWHCYLNCGNNRGNGWSREDKWKEHIRREHPSFTLAKPDTRMKN